MPFNNLDVTLTPAQVTAIQAAIDALKTNVPFGVNLTKNERTSLPNLKDERYSFVSKVVVNHAPVNPGLVSGFAGTLVEAQTDFTLYNQLRNFILQLNSVVEMYNDTQQVAGSEVYKFGRVFYGTAQTAAENNVPGADAIVDDLSEVYEGQGTTTTPTP